MKSKENKIITALLLALFITVFAPFSHIVQATENKENKLPSIVGKYAVTMDYETGEIIYAKNADDRAYPASTTKLLTALIFAENANKTDVIPYTQNAKQQPEYSLNKNFKPININDTMSADNVMKALLLYSANDAAYMIADSVSGNSKNFATIMNDKIASLGLKNTHFVTPNGLHKDNHYTTAYDMAVITRSAFENSWVRDVMGLKKATIDISNGTKIMLENRNKYIGKDGNIGGKTGYTSKANRCLTAVYERDGRKIVGTVLNSEYDAKDETVFKDMNKIMDYSFNAKKSTLLKANEIVETIPVEYKAFKFFGPKKTIDVPMVLTKDVTYYKNPINDSNISYEVSINDKDAWHIASNSDAAKLIVTERNSSTQYNLTPDIGLFSIIKANILLYIGSFIIFIAIIILILFVIRGINIRKRRRNRRRIF
ncbi:D-alanyl-D-alanine carboxypeptidase family protein [Clostridium tarantellae]|uniref:D-alanyl-D-alanine carboxypeptidase n=1 Tax=Clostridium tarantellae TaxID=39493 RepID=A0A6I1MKA5_9CLOT|nr:D-alanyl-D-alanine carboxypeptidase family protein [Clostridium tarantellae]MPQ43956.1 D-alanyl-D-alanine carboxypeptidase [Clostridium tarantellae]